MNKITLVIFSLLTSFGVCQSQHLVEAEFISNSPAFVLGFVPEIPNTYDVDFYKITYNTVDLQGNPTVASGAVSIPSTEDCNFFPLAAYCHGTVLRQNDVPSENNFEALITKVWASSGYICVAPDYLGLGINAGIHPYVHQESQATATVDLIRAVREFLSTTELSDNGETYITGYSQGGHAAMGTLKYIQENDLTEELGLVAGAPCSGPYNLSGAQSEIILSDVPYSNPGYVVYLLMSYELAYGNIYTDLGDIIQAPYDEDVLPFFDGAQDSFDMTSVNAILPGQLSDLMVDTVLANFESNPNHPLWQALEANDNSQWVPNMPVRMYYCDGDEQVNFSNSTTTEQWMNDNGAPDVASQNSLAGADHGGCVIPALSDAYAFFETIATPCETTNTASSRKLEPLEIYPNPAQLEVNIILPEGQGELILQDLIGRIILHQNILTKNYKLDISSLPQGAYVVSVKTENSIRKQTLIVQ